MKNCWRLYSLLLLGSATFTAGQQASIQSPCDYSGKLLRSSKGDIVRFTSDEMKQRASHKADVGKVLKQTDIKGTVIIDVLVGSSGKVFCMETLYGHPIISADVEKALHTWTFKPAKMSGEVIAYLGRLEFLLCNINCGDQGTSMTLLK